MQKKCENKGVSPLSPLRGHLPQRGRREGAPEHLPPPLGEVAEQSEDGGGNRAKRTAIIHSSFFTLHSSLKSKTSPSPERFLISYGLLMPPGWPPMPPI